jgi:hypothetical protein
MRLLLFEKAGHLRVGAFRQITAKGDDFRFCRKFRFWGKMRKSGIRNSMTYRLPNSRKSKFATEPPILHLGPRLGIERCGKINSLNSGSDNCTGMGVLSGYLAVVLIMGGPHVKNFDSNRRIGFPPYYKRLGPFAKLAINSLQK